MKAQSFDPASIMCLSMRQVRMQDGSVASSSAMLSSTPKVQR